MNNLNTNIASNNTSKRIDAFKDGINKALIRLANMLG